jgi:hypothetical protein
MSKVRELFLALLLCSVPIVFGTIVSKNVNISQPVAFG